MKKNKFSIFLILSVILSFVNTVCSLIIARKAEYYFLYSKLSPLRRMPKGMEMFSVSKKIMIQDYVKGIFVESDDYGVLFYVFTYIAVALTIITTLFLINTIIDYKKGKDKGCIVKSKLSFYIGLAAIISSMCARIQANKILSLAYIKNVLYANFAKKSFSLTLYDITFSIGIVCVICYFLLWDSNKYMNEDETSIVWITRVVEKVKAMFCNKRNRLLVYGILLAFVNAFCMVTISKAPAYYFTEAKVGSCSNLEMIDYDLHIEDAPKTKSAKRMRVIRAIEYNLFEDGRGLGGDFYTIIFATLYLSIITTVCIMLTAINNSVNYQDRYVRFSRLSIIMSIVTMILNICGRVNAGNILKNSYRGTLEFERRIFSLSLYDTSLILCIICVILCIAIYRGRRLCYK